MLIAVKREYKMSFYDLNTVAKFFVDKSKHDIKAEKMFKIYEAMKNAKPGTKEYAEAMSQMTEVMLYCIQDSELVLDIMDEINMWIAVVEMSDIVGVDIEAYLIRGQQARCVAQLYHLAVQDGHVVDKRDCPDIPFEGGFVNRPTPGLHDNVIFLDFKSLYPSIIRAYNICYTTLVHPDSMYINGKINEELKAQCNTISITCTEEYDPDEDKDEDEMSEMYKANGLKGSYEFWFKKSPQGLLPRLVGNLVDKRNAVKDILKNEKDPLQKIILDKRQNGLKVCANSFFGFLGIREGGKLPLLEGAMSITAWGRKLIGEVNEMIVKKYKGIVIYGDTDSSAVVLPEQVKSSAQCDEWGRRLSKEISAHFPPPVEIDYEKSVEMLSIKKKKYAGIFYSKDGSFKREKNGDLSLLIRGILIARRDNCKWARDIYKKILIMVLTRTDMRVVIQTLFDEIDRLLAGKVPLEDLIIVRTLGANYKSETYYMKVFADELRKIGKPAQPGERLQYLVVERPEISKGKKLPLGKRLVLQDMYLESLETATPEKLDYMYYIEKVLQNHVDQLISTGYNNIIPRMGLVWHPTPKHNYLGLDNVTALVMKMREYNIHHSVLMAEIDRRMKIAEFQMAKEKEESEIIMLPEPSGLIMVM